MSTYENSWHVAVPDLKKSNITHHHYICKCGNIKQIALKNHHADFPYLICPNCSNSYYLDLQIFQGSVSVRYWKEFNWSYELMEDADGWHIHFYYLTPILHNSLTTFKSEKQSLEKVSLFKNGLSQTMTPNRQLLKCAIFDDDNTEIETMINQQTATPLLKFILENLSQELTWINFKRYDNLSDEKTLLLIAFFLQNPNMKDETLFFWDFKGCEELMTYTSSETQGLSLVLGSQTKKSIKKALYNSYIVEKDCSYNPKSDFIFCSIFNDENLIVSLINLKEKKKLFENFSMDIVLRALGFLRNYYSQKEIYTLITGSLDRDSKVLFEDILRMLGDEDVLHIYLEYFKRVRTNISVIHDKLAQINRRYVSVWRHNAKLEDALKPFSYAKEYKDSFSNKVDNLEFYLPNAPIDVYNWADILHNCMASYVDAIVQKRSVIVGVFKNSKLLYAVEIRNYKIHQALGKYNKPIEYNDKETIKKWFKSIGIKPEYVKSVA